MLERLLESRFKPERSVGGTIASVTGHTALVAAALYPDISIVPIAGRSPCCRVEVRHAAAEIGGRKVRQLVQMPFVFKLSR